MYFHNFSFPKFLLAAALSLLLNAFQAECLTPQIGTEPKVSSIKTEKSFWEKAKEDFESEFMKAVFDLSPFPHKLRLCSARPTWPIYQPVSPGSVIPQRCGDGNCSVFEDMQRIKAAGLAYEPASDLSIPPWRFSRGIAAGLPVADEVQRPPFLARERLVKKIPK